MKRIFVIALSFFLLVSFVNCAPQSKSLSSKRDRQERGQDRYEKEFNVKSGQKLKVDFEAGGSINIEGWDKEVVSVKISLRGRDAEDVLVEIEETSYGVYVHTEYDGWDNDRNLRQKTKIMVPKKFDLDFSTTGGSVSIDNVEGDLEGETMGGSLDLKYLKGKLAMETMGGSIDLSDSDVDGFVKTMGGSVDVNDVTGTVDIHTMGGSISQHNVKGREGSDDEVEITTMGGSIDVDEAPNGARVKTMGGSIRAEKVSKYIEAETMGGSIKIKSIDGWVKAKTMGGDIYCRMVGDPEVGKKDVRLTSMSGDIELYVPEGLDMDIEIEIEYDDRHEDEVELITDFDVEKEVSRSRRRDDGWRSREWKTLIAEGKTGSGKNKIRIKTVNGSVYLKTK